jgi:cytochrome c oxidase cbb3-type subunit 3
MANAEEISMTGRVSARRSASSAWLSVALALAAGCAQSAPASQDARAVDAPQLFVQACAKCHGADGTGGLSMATNGPRPIDLGNPEWQRARSDEELVAAIRDGRGAMPPFNDVLAPAQISALARHVRTLRRP